MLGIASEHNYYDFNDDVNNNIFNTDNTDIHITNNNNEKKMRKKKSTSHFWSGVLVLSINSIKYKKIIN